MTKIAYRDATEDEPIYTEGFYVSLYRCSRKHFKSTVEDDLTGPKTSNDKQEESFGNGRGRVTPEKG